MTPKTNLDFFVVKTGASLDFKIELGSLHISPDTSEICWYYIAYGQTFVLKNAIIKRYLQIYEDRKNVTDRTQSITHNYVYL
jgi:hypothetical protein